MVEAAEERGAAPQRHSAAGTYLAAAHEEHEGSRQSRSRGGKHGIARKTDGGTETGGEVVPYRDY